MMPSWTYLVIGSGITALINLAVQEVARRQARISAAEQKFTKALASDDLTTLATYLRDDLGAVPVESYLKNADVRRDVDRYIARLADFVAAPEVAPSVEVIVDLPPVTRPEPAPPPQAETNRSPQKDPPEIKRALSTLENGDVWSSLARLRRDLETTMRALREAGHDKVLGLRPGHPSGRFSLTTDVPPEATGSARLFYRTASAAVHGQQVTFDAALDAIDHARSVFEAIRQRLPNYREALPSEQVGEQQALSDL